MTKLESPNKKPVSEKKKAASRENGKRSKGPITAEGKARVAMNAITHGCTSKLVVLPSEDPNEYNALRQNMLDDLKPCNEGRFTLVDMMAADTWRYQRALKAETARIAEKIDDALTKLNTERKAFIRKGYDMFKQKKGGAVPFLSTRYEGVEALLETWDIRTRNVSDYRVWDCKHYEIFMELHGLPKGTIPKTAGTWAFLAYSLCVYNGDENFEGNDAIGTDEVAEQVNTRLQQLLKAKRDSLVPLLENLPNPNTRRNRVIDIASFDESKDGMNLARHQDRVVRSFRSGLKELTNLMKTNSDLVFDDDPSPDLDAPTDFIPDLPTPHIAQPTTTIDENKPTEIILTPNHQNKPTEISKPSDHQNKPTEVVVDEPETADLVAVLPKKVGNSRPKSFNSRQAPTRSAFSMAPDRPFGEKRDASLDSEEMLDRCDPDWPNES
jgi:hypothetical protein